MSARSTTRANACATESRRRSPPATISMGLPPASSDGGGLCAHSSRQRDNDVIDRVAAAERVHAALENRSPSEQQELLGLCAAEAEAAAAGRDESRDVQGACIQALLILAVPSDPVLLPSAHCRLAPPDGCANAERVARGSGRCSRAATPSHGSPFPGARSAPRAS